MMGRKDDQGEEEVRGKREGDGVRNGMGWDEEGREGTEEDRGRESKDAGTSVDKRRRDEPMVEKSLALGPLS